MGIGKTVLPPPSSVRPIKFQTETEAWGEYTLEDGSTIHVRLVLMRVTVDDKSPFNPDGSVRYLCNFQQVMDVDVSDLAKQSYAKDGPNA